MPSIGVGFSSAIAWCERPEQWAFGWFVMLFHTEQNRPVGPLSSGGHVRSPTRPSISSRSLEDIGCCCWLVRLYEARGGLMMRDEGRGTGWRVGVGRCMAAFRVPERKKWEVCSRQCLVINTSDPIVWNGFYAPQPPRLSESVEPGHPDCSGVMWWVRFSPLQIRTISSPEGNHYSLPCGMNCHP